MAPIDAGIAVVPIYSFLPGSTDVDQMDDLPDAPNLPSAEVRLALNCPASGVVPARRLIATSREVQKDEHLVPDGVREACCRASPPVFAVPSSAWASESVR
jgi:hypothetical protein